MKLVTMTGELARRFGDKKAIEMIKAAGFDGYDYTMMGGDDDWRKELKGDDALEHVRALREFSDEIGLSCLQAHAPCLGVPTFVTEETYVQMTLRAIEFAAELGCGVLVVHPGCYFTAEQNRDLIYSKVLPSAEKLNVKIATENMYKWKDERQMQTAPAACGTAADFVAHVDCVNHPYFTACLDLGHAQMINCEGAAAMIQALGKDRLGALHVHDNDLVNDDHTFPFVGKSDWEEITEALAKINYQGHFTFETDALLSRYPDELTLDLLKLLERTGRYLISRVESKRRTK